MPGFEYTVIRKNVKGLSLRIFPDLQIRVTVPTSFPQHEVEKWVESKSKWVEEKLAHYRNIKPVPLREEEDVMILGEVIQSGFPSANKAILTAWYKTQAKKYLIPRVVQLADYHGFRFGKVFIRDTKSKWGSCSSLNNIGLNYRLIKAPSFIIDYVIIHELCHTVHFNHSPEFWSLVQKHCPDYKTAQDWLKTHGITLS
ncbi:MAG: M48 family metallopeptidase [Bacteroidia bacterium]|nr:M48 family metallopeptidase [Bacteroidia bacterium]